jgi:hypothetical protein
MDEISATLAAAHAKLTQELSKVREKFDAGADDWRHALLLVYVKYCRAVGIDRRLIEPILKMMLETDDAILRARRRDKGDTKKSMPLDYASALTLTAAAVTFMKERGSTVPEAERAVASASGIDRKVIKGFRDNLNRGKAPRVATQSYEAALAAMSGLADADMLKERLKGLSRFVT